RVRVHVDVLFTRMRLTLWTAADPETLDREAALSGRLRTSLGRALAFTGVPLVERPLLAQRGYNGLSRALVAGKRLLLGSEPDSLILDLADEGLAACRRAVRHRPALCAALVLDLVPIAILNWRRGRPMMACRGRRPCRRRLR